MFTLLPARSHMGTLLYCLSFPFLELQVWCVLQRKQLSLTQSTELKHACHCTYDEITYASSGISFISLFGKNASWVLLFLLLWDVATHFWWNCLNYNFLPSFSLIPAYFCHTARCFRWRTVSSPATACQVESNRCRFVTTECSYGSSAFSLEITSEMF